MDGGTVVCERRDDVLLVGLNRPDKRNALDRATVEDLHRVLAEARGERCILVLHSTTPGMFVAGADIAELAARDADDALLAINAGLFERLEAHRWPTIAVVDGPALGGGCELALACDLRVASTRARFAQPELSLGILDAGRALDCGLVDAVHDPEEVFEAALEMARTIATRSWRALELTKLALRLHRPDTTVFDVAAQALLFEDEDKRKRMQTFLDRRRT
jgi:enoyl-CoA hydratase/carnithine racemase